MVDLPSLRFSAATAPVRPPVVAAPPAEGAQHAGPDLVVDGVYPSNPFPFPGDPVFYRVSVRNQGDEPAGQFGVQLNGAVFGPEKRLAGLNPGQRVFIPMGNAWAPFGGALTVQAVVDPHNEVAESNEGNNYQWNTVWVQQPPVPPPYPPYPPHPAAPTVMLAE